VTEAEWLAATDPAPMLEFLRGKVSGRKLRLFACACCRRVWHLLKYDDSQRAIEVAERYADDAATDEELAAARRASGIPKTAGLGGTTTRPAAAAACACCDRKPFVAATLASGRAVSAGNLKRERVAQIGLCREIFGNPFRPVTPDLGWFTSTVLALAEGVYADRAFDRLPILADALQDAGCEDAAVLEHCRGPGPHARGCWVVDLVLGKT
jgi:hypothetical protein